MRRLIGVVVLVMGLAGCAGMQAAPKEQLTFSQVYEVDGVERGQLFDGVRAWIAENFRSAKSVIEVADKESGLVIGNGSMTYPCSGLSCVGVEGVSVRYTMRVDLKDGRMRVAFSNLERVSEYGVHPVWMQGDVDAIRPVLLSYGERIKESIVSGKAAADW